MSYYELKAEILNIMTNYIESLRHNDLEYIKELKDEYKVVREELILNKNKFKGLSQRKFIKVVVKNEDLSTTPKYIQKGLKKEKNERLFMTLITFLATLVQAKRIIIDEEKLYVIVLFSCLSLSLIYSKQYDAARDEIDDIKRLINENINNN